MQLRILPLVPMSKQEFTVIFPHQLFKQHPGLLKGRSVILLEHPLLFGTDAQYPQLVHMQKAVLLRAAMKAYEQCLLTAGYSVQYIEHSNATLQQVNTTLGTANWHMAKLVDYAIEQRLKALHIQCTWYESPMFLNSTAENTQYHSKHKAWKMQSFYKYQRRRLGVLMNGDEPEGGQWSFDESNRKKVPKNEVDTLPVMRPVHETVYHTDAKEYVKTHCTNTIGNCTAVYYPVTHEAAASWLQTFLEERFAQFGPYEDAIEPDKDMLFHSILTPMLNIGLLTPRQVLAAVAKYTSTHTVPIESHEGFVRQIIGWREFMRATYEEYGVQMRTGNHWQHSHAIPKAFYTGLTGIEPVDNCIKRLLDTGYCHHIERLMILGGFMFICECDPKAIYTWFMEMFIDSYDWVMVPNVYAMSQNSCGGLITTKPYFSGSNYVKKMSHYTNGKWQSIWDGLYWSFIDKHANTLSQNPRWAMMCSMVKKMDQATLATHKKNAKQFLATLL